MTIFGRDLQVGDVLVMGYGHRTITDIDPHPGLTALYHEPARLAQSGSWSTMILDDDIYQIIRPER
jgi:hypothetical protein